MESGKVHETDDTPKRRFEVDVRAVWNDGYGLRESKTTEYVVAANKVEAREKARDTVQKALKRDGTEAIAVAGLTTDVTDASLPPELFKE